MLLLGVIHFWTLLAHELPTKVLVPGKGGHPELSGQCVRDGALQFVIGEVKLSKILFEGRDGAREFIVLEMQFLEGMGNVLW